MKEWTHYYPMSSYCMQGFHLGCSTAQPSPLHSKSRIFLLGAVNKMLSLWNFNLSKRTLSTLNALTCPVWSLRALGVQLSHFWALLLSSIICRLWLSIINTLPLVPSRGNNIISSKFLQDCKEMNSAEAIFFKGMWSIVIPRIKCHRWFHASQVQATAGVHPLWH